MKFSILVENAQLYSSPQEVTFRFKRLACIAIERNAVLTYERFPRSAGSVAVEANETGLHLPHVADPKVNVLSGQMHCSEIQMGT